LKDRVGQGGRERRSTSMNRHCCPALCPHIRTRSTAVCAVVRTLDRRPRIRSGVGDRTCTST
jgi:hypothetical protein